MLSTVANPTTSPGEHPLRYVGILTRSNIEAFEPWAEFLFGFAKDTPGVLDNADVLSPPHIPNGPLSFIDELDVNVDRRSLSFGVGDQFATLL